MDDEQDHRSDQTSLKPEIIDNADLAYGSIYRDHTQHSWSQVIPTDSGAILAISLAIASWFVIPVVGAVSAILTARAAKRRIQASNGTLRGLSLTSAGQWIAWANILAFVLLLWILVWILKRLF